MRDAIVVAFTTKMLEKLDIADACSINVNVSE